MKRKCKRCEVEKPIEEYYPRPNRPGGISYHCKDCERARKTEYMRKYRHDHPEETKRRDREWRRANPDRVREMNLKKFYKMTSLKYEEMLKEQHHKCIICGYIHNSEGTREQKLHIDHCHNSSKVRGLLCTQCNKGLGHFRDNIDFVAKALEYLKKHK